MHKPEINISAENEATNSAKPYMDRVTTELLAALSDKFSYVYFLDPYTGEYDAFAYANPLGVPSLLLDKEKRTDFYSDTQKDIDNIVRDDYKKIAWKTFSKESLIQIADSGISKAVELCWYIAEREETLWVRDKIIRFFDADGNKKIVIGIEDITQQRKDDEVIMRAIEIEKASLTDPLTGCKNRQAISWAYNGDFKIEKSIGVVSCDLNGLKKKNDKEGHAAGDKLICDVADLLTGFFKKIPVYRVGGDEFIVILMSLSKDEFDDSVSRLKKECLEKDASISIGYAYSSDTDTSFEKLLHDADIRMYEDKRLFYRRMGIDRRSHSEMYRNEEFLEALVDWGFLCYLACKINLTANTYEIIHIMDGYDTGFRKECTNLDELLNYPASKGIVHKDDVEDYQKYTTRDYLCRFAKSNNGQSDHWIKFRSKYGRDEYHLVEVQFFFGREYSDDNQVGYAILKDMGKPFRTGQLFFEEVMRILSEGYDSIVYVDCEKDEIIPYRINSQINEIMDGCLEKNAGFIESMQKLIDVVVCAKDKEIMEKICDISNLRKQFNIRKSFSQDFRIVYNGNEIYYRGKFAKVGDIGDLKQFIIGFENISNEKLFNRDFRKTGDKILIVEDLEINREILRSMLKDKYSLIEARNGNEAIAVLEKHYGEVALVIADIIMPECDGFELLKRINSDRRFCTIPVIVSTVLGEDGNKAKCLELGAADFINKPYNEHVIKNRIAGILKTKDIEETLSKIEMDSVTGLYAREAFYSYAQNILDSNPDKDYTIIVSDIVGFKTINEQYGIEMGNKLLYYLARNGLNNKNGVMIAGRVSGDNLVSIMSEFEISEEQLQKDIEQIIEESPVPNPDVKYGLYDTRDGRNIKIQRMCDRARIALSSIKQEYGRNIVTYDDSMGDRIRKEQFILKSMDKALEDNQFVVCYQPKFDIVNNTIAGAEALVRWNNPEMGFMNPSTFIPIFEKNGFISKLDKYVWKKVCEDISEWNALGFDFPISVNVSRRDFSDPNLAEHITELTDSYNLEHDRVHLEITESAYSDNPEELKCIIKKLHEKGFVIELDDFGTGYSSLTALNSMDIDILKLDLSIIRDDNTESDNNVLDFAMGLAKIMKLKTVQEGVETEEQLTRVKKLGCNYVQGYYFAKPLDRKSFVEYVKIIMKNQNKQI